MPKVEVLISVDIEASGPIPGEYSMLSLGACVVDEPQSTFAIEIAPISPKFDPEALAVAGLSMAELAARGTPAEKAMTDFAAWIHGVCGEEDKTPVFVGLNAPFDWSFVNYYFHRFTGSNPFGFSALDIKAYFMGATGCRWQETKSSEIAKLVQPTLAGNHDALHDAVYQAELFRLLRSKVVAGGAI